MKWRGRGGSRNIEDRRGQGGRGFGGRGFGGRGGGGRGFRIPVGRGGGGLGGLILVVVLIFGAMIFGFDPVALLNGQVVPTSSTQDRANSPSGQNQSSDEMTRFVGVVVGDTERYWRDVFARNGRQYSEPNVVLFTGRSPSGCGLADAATGPFYCPTDEKIYIDLSFYDQLRRQFGAGGDFAEAYVLAHEVGHHVQNLTGVLPAFNKARARMSKTEANAYSVRVELQADCYAGTWAAYEGNKGYLERGDIEEALNAATKIGDDALQKKSQGYVVPDSFTHGSAAQRSSWFKRGYDSGDWAACDTFSASQI